MSPAGQVDPELDALIEEITVDCYDEDEQLMGFENAFYDANFPCRGTNRRRDHRGALCHHHRQPPRADRYLPTQRQTL